MRCPASFISSILCTTLHCHSFLSSQSIDPQQCRILPNARRESVDIEVRDELDDENDDQEEVGESEIDSASDSDGDT